jgi:hypothetical protein
MLKQPPSPENLDKMKGILKLADESLAADYYNGARVHTHT